MNSQIPVDGRKKTGGVTFAKTQEEAKQEGARIFGADLRGYAVKDIQKEYFLVVTYDTAAKTAVLVFSAEVGSCSRLDQRKSYQNGSV